MKCLMMKVVKLCVPKLVSGLCGRFAKKGFGSRTRNMVVAVVGAIAAAILAILSAVADGELSEDERQQIEGALSAGVEQVESVKE